MGRWRPLSKGDGGGTTSAHGGGEGQLLPHSEPTREPTREPTGERWRPLEPVRSIAALVAAVGALSQLHAVSAHHGTETRVLLSAIRAQATRAKHTSSDTDTHTHKGTQRRAADGSEFSTQKKKGPPLSFPTGNNLLNGFFFFLPNGKKLCIYIPTPLPQSSPPRRSARTSPLTRVCVCVCTQPLNFFIFSIETAD